MSNALFCLVVSFGPRSAGQSVVSRFFTLNAVSPAARAAAELHGIYSVCTAGRRLTMSQASWRWDEQLSPSSEEVLGAGLLGHVRSIRVRRISCASPSALALIEWWLQRKASQLPFVLLLEGACGNIVLPPKLCRGLLVALKMSSAAAPRDKLLSFDVEHNHEALSSLVSLTLAFWHNGEVLHGSVLAQLPKLLRFSLSVDKLEMDWIAELHNISVLAINTSSAFDLLTLANLNQLESLLLSVHSIEHPEELQRFRSLRQLGLETQPALVLDPSHWELPPQVDSLTVHSAHGVKIEASMQQLASLKRFCSRGSIDLSDVEGYRMFRDLQHLDIRGSLQELDIDVFRSCEDLLTLNVVNCSRFSMGSGFLSFLSSLVVVDVSGSSVEDLAPLTVSRGLEHLDFSKTRVMGDLQFLRKASNLKTLNLSYTPISSFTGLANHPRLVEVLAIGCANLSTVTDAMMAPNLTTLSLKESGIQRFVGTLKLENLRLLDCTRCSQLADLAGLSNSPRLSTLLLSSTPVASFSVEGLRTLAAEQCVIDVKKHHKLYHLDATRCHKLTTAEALARLPFLTRMCLRFTSITELDGFNLCPCLETVLLSGCKHLCSIIGLSGAPRLKVLELRGSAITELTGLSRCPSLEYVDVCACTCLTSLAGLDGSPRLTTVHAVGCSLTQPVLSRPFPVRGSTTDTITGYILSYFRR